MSMGLLRPSAPTKMFRHLIWRSAVRAKAFLKARAGASIRFDSMFWKWRRGTGKSLASGGLVSRANPSNVPNQALLNGAGRGIFLCESCPRPPRYQSVQKFSLPADMPRNNSGGAACKCSRRISVEELHRTKEKAPVSIGASNLVSWLKAGR